MNNPERIIMVRPAHFGFNAETAESNKFQQSIALEGTSELALSEFDSMVETLRNNDIEVLVLGRCYLRKENQNPQLIRDYRDEFELD